MSGTRRPTLQLVYTHDGRLRGVERMTPDGTGARAEPADDAQAVERLMSYLCEELRMLDKHQSAHLVGAAIQALRDDADGIGGPPHR